MISEPEDMACGRQPVRVGSKVELTGGQFRGMTGVLVRYSRGLNGLVQLDGVPPGVLLMIDPASLQQLSPAVSGNRIKPADETTPQLADQDFTAG
jgi:hypothetical protein